MKKIYTHFVLIVLFGINCYAQDQQINCANALSINRSISGFKVFQYPDSTIAGKIQTVQDADYSTPETLMSSVLSAATLEWFNQNRIERAESTNQDFGYIRNADAEQYFFELKYKVEFTRGSQKFAIIKYVLNDYDNEQLGFAEAMQETKSGWKTTIDAGISEMLFFLGVVQVKYLNDIFISNTSENAQLNDILRVNSSNAGLELNAILYEIQARLNANNQELREILDPKRIFK